jgi:hypothetical protein
MRPEGRASLGGIEPPRARAGAARLGAVLRGLSAKGEYLERRKTFRRHDLWLAPFQLLHGGGWFRHETGPGV